ncbi:MAG: MFS transporter, partial [Chloroflexi bacterium]|nr:MFS transporter [Chloroflexota bacterium]
FALRMAAGIMGSMLQLYFDWIDSHVEPISFTMRGIIIGVFFLPELIGSPVLGAWSDKYGRKLFILLGPITGALAVQITALTTFLPLLAITRFLEGLSTASAIPATLGYLSEVTSHDDHLRGRVVGIFEIATLGGTIAGILLGGPLFDTFQNHAFTLNSIFYLISLAIFFFGMKAHARRPQQSAVDEIRTVLHEMRKLRTVIRLAFAPIASALGSGRILRFVPAWLAINMVLGVWLNSVVGQLVNKTHSFPGQVLFGLLRDSPNQGTQISIGSGVLLGVFGLGVFIWSLMLGRFRRTSVMLASAFGLFALVAILFTVNHAETLRDPIIAPLLVVGALALMLLSGFTPAALTYLADLTEDAPNDRGAIMGLYSVFFGLGQFIGQLLGGPFGDWQGFDGILILTSILGAISVVTLLRLHGVEQAHTTAAMATE